MRAEPGAPRDRHGHAHEDEPHHELRYRSGPLLAKHARESERHQEKAGDEQGTGHERDDESRAFRSRRFPTQERFPAERASTRTPVRPPLGDLRAPPCEQARERRAERDQEERQGLGERKLVDPGPRDGDHEGHEGEEQRDAGEKREQDGGHRPHRVRRSPHDRAAGGADRGPEVVLRRFSKCLDQWRARDQRRGFWPVVHDSDDFDGGAHVAMVTDALAALPSAFRTGPEVKRVVLEGEQVLSNAAFLAKYAAAGRVGLVGGESFIEKMIRRAQRRQVERRTWSQWGHAFLFEGLRVDGEHWVIESDLDVHRERAVLGVQENHVSKYHDDDAYTALAVLDFGLSPDQVRKALTEGLRLLTTRTQYSLREIAALSWKLKTPDDRGRQNRLSRGDRAIFCSAFVQHLYQVAAQIDSRPRSTPS